MDRSRTGWLLIVGLVALAQVGVGVPSATLTTGRDAPLAHPHEGAAETGAARWLSSARAVQASTRAHLRVTDQPDCADASFISYRRSDLQPSVADQWYIVSQLWADAELLRATARQSTRAAGSGAAPGSEPDEPGGARDEETRCYLARGFLFLDRLRGDGGYYARAAPDGSSVERDVHYADDNALAGLSLLAAAAVEPNPLVRQHYLDGARSVATFLTTSGLWDETFGGGFWWSSNKGDRWEGKPAQSNALAALFFARLGAATGDDTHSAWALLTLGWLDAVLYDPDTRLYRWSARYEDLQHRSGGPILINRYFNYDQAIAIEAQLAVARFDGRADRLDRAREIGRVMHGALWNADHGGYNLEVGVNRIYESYGAWASFGHLALYDLDGEPSWLEMAEANADALDAMFRRADGGYGFRHYRCVTTVERSRPGCEGGESLWVVDQTRDGAAQAWMQHLQAAIARRQAPPSTVPARQRDRAIVLGEPASRQ
jgi:hypothetical protein